MIHLYGPLEYSGSESFEEFRWSIMSQNLFVRMTDGENDFEVEYAKASISGTSFENAMVCVDLEVNFGIYGTNGKCFDIYMD